MEETFDHQFKIILIGDSRVGKSCLLTRYTRGVYNEVSTTTIGMEFASKIIQIEDKKIKLSIWDTAGQERFQSVNKIYYKGAVGAVLMYDITSREAFENVANWYSQILEYQEENYIVMMLVGNKSDLEHNRVVQKDEGINWAQQHKIGFIETSVKDGTNVEFPFQKLTEQIYSLLVKKTVKEDDKQDIDNKDILGLKSQVLKYPDSKNEKEKKKSGGCC